jgi:cytochrome c oxidase subunit II
MEKTLGLPLGMPPDASAHGLELDKLTAIVHWFMIVLFVGWGLFFLYCLFRFRKKAHPVASYGGAKGHFSTWGEAGVVLIEVILLVAFAVPIWAKRVGAVPDKSQAVQIRVVAEQFAWNIHYPGADGVFGRTDPKLITAGSNPLGLDRDDPVGKDDVTSINQLHLPVDKPVLIYLSSKDVIHSFFLPEMRVKQDAIPGQVIPIYFTAVKVNPPEAILPGCAVKKTCWEIACAQLCGLTHYRMQGYLTVETQADYDAWLAKVAPKAPTTAPAVVTPLPPTGSPSPEPATASGAAPVGSNPAGNAPKPPSLPANPPPSPPPH